MAPKVTSISKPNVSSDVFGTHTGKAPAIRKLKLSCPELSEADIAKVVGCSPSNVHAVLKRFLGMGDSQADLRDYQENKAEVFDALQFRILGSITQEDIAKAQLLPRVTAAAILEDKARVIRGQATAINVSVLMDVMEAIRSRPMTTVEPAIIEAETAIP